MNHPHKEYLNEFKIAIDKLVPLTPVGVIEEAKNIYLELSGDVNVSIQQIHQALTLIGRKEFPYRKAYDEICASDEEQRLQKLVFSRLDETVQNKLREVTKHGVLLEDYINSKLFEERFSGDERYQIENAILLVDDELNNQCDERAHSRQKTFTELVEKWGQESRRLQVMINRLREMGDEDEKWKGEINSVADRLEEGWSVVERDPEEEEIIKELEYWNTVLYDINE